MFTDCWQDMSAVHNWRKFLLAPYICFVKTPNPENILSTRDVVSVSTSRSRDGLETYRRSRLGHVGKRLGLGSYDLGLGLGLGLDSLGLVRKSLQIIFFGFGSLNCIINYRNIIFLMKTQSSDKTFNQGLFVYLFFHPSLRLRDSFFWDTVWSAYTMHL